MSKRNIGNYQFLKNKPDQNVMETEAQVTKDILEKTGFRLIF
jgi:hypothetical protein